MADAQDKTPIPAIPATTGVHVDIKRDEKAFSSGYANSVIVESNAFDVKMIFGLYDHRVPTNPIVNQFSSMTLSWVQTKILIYLLQVHLAGFERENGKVKIPTNAMPPELPATLPPPFDNQKGQETLEFLRRMREEFVASLSKP